MPPSPKKKSTSKATKKPTARGTRSTKTVSKKNTKPAAGARQRRAKVKETLSSPPAPEPAAPKPMPAEPTQADLREAIRVEEENKPAPVVTSTPQVEIQKIRESAKRLGIQLDEEEALQWLTQMAVQDKA